MPKLRLVSSLLLLTLTATGCAWTSQHQNDHWNARSIPGRANKYFVGYDGQRDGSPGQFISDNASSIGLLFSRHFLNYNPDNPNQAGAAASFSAPSNPNGDRDFKVSKEYEKAND